MSHLVVCSKEDISRETRTRKNETKVGENVQVLKNSDASLLELLSQSDAEYVLLGRPEDIGIRANGCR